MNSKGHCPGEKILSITESLIGIPSVTGDELEVARWISNWMRNQGWPVIEMPVAQGRFNLFVSFGTPRIVFTTHMDVVPAATHLFTPQRKGDVLYGRGACDAKGSLALILEMARQLRSQNADNFALLFVVGEEMDGVGARISADYLVGRGVEYLVNAEPTEGRFAAATKGVLDFDVEILGRSCHSGYPKYGEDANRLLIECAQRLYSLNLGVDDVLGSGLINIGRIEAGTAANVISQSASMSCCVRTVERCNERIKALIRSVVAPSVPVFSLDVSAISLSVPQWETDPYIAAYVSDVGQFSILDCELFLCGPGSILTAHTDDESISLEEIETAYRSYIALYDSLSR